MAFFSLSQPNTPPRSYWKVVLSSGRELREDRTRLDIRVAGLRPLDWSLDLVSTGDVLNVRELYLLCPDGQEAMLPITEPGTAFQMKTRTLHGFGANESILEAQIIGRVVDKEHLICDCWIWDRVLGLLQYKSTLAEPPGFGTWHERLAPAHFLSLPVLGVRL